MANFLSLEKDPRYHYRHIDRAAKILAEEIDADVSLCIKAAQIAHDPSSLEGLVAHHSLSNVEQEALRNEKTKGFFQQSKALKTAIITLCLSAVTQGWVQAATSGSNVHIAYGIGCNETNNRFSDTTIVWRMNAFGAIASLTAAVVGCWISESLQSQLGRRGAIFALSLLCIFATIGTASIEGNNIITNSEGWSNLLLWRSLLGFGLGGNASVAFVFSAEISPTHLRGKLGVTSQTFNAFGFLCGFTFNLILAQTSNISWRFASAAVPAVCLLTIIYTIPESPYWLLKRHRRKEAFISLCALRQTPLQAIIELFVTNAHIQKEAAPIQARTNDGTSYWNRLFGFYHDSRTYSAVVAASVLMLGQQLCGM